uniref:Uncharacterized protein n=1 Tax=Hyaloperonospora arabidopsidis (strain Emoy2) TaxID=559515 RepID=M4BPP2_HYAAE
MELRRPPSCRAIQKSRESCPDRQAVRRAPMFCCRHCPHMITRHQARHLLLLTRKSVSEFHGRLMTFHEIPMRVRIDLR